MKKLACVLALSTTFGNALAADVYTPVSPEAQTTTTASGWTFTIAPYFWMAGLAMHF